MDFCQKHESTLFAKVLKPIRNQVQVFTRGHPFVVRYNFEGACLDGGLVGVGSIPDDDHQILWKLSKSQIDAICDSFKTDPYQSTDIYPQASPH